MCGRVDVCVWLRELCRDERAPMRFSPRLVRSESRSVRRGGVSSPSGRAAPARSGVLEAGNISLNYYLEK